ncbi:MAG: tRNA (adenosine(37)-N6)-threonylcarbamoyltransferase complex transferase subunit TsaD [Oligosphaeraceae bacterium]|nr:tRNA (adenosine(37)-N6)-threonylcarbamoyltransferase complex transferase subunit TsaD [Oligosphaeraceae bacterium]
MIVLGIESSCDETAAALVRDGHELLASCISTQVKLHAAYGGVIPELAAREHLKNITPVISTVFEQAKLSIEAVDAVAVTNGPGLIPALLVGNSYAKGLAMANKLPLLGVNHFEAHIYAAFLKHPELLKKPSNFPLLALVVSGGHTALVLIQADGQAELLGSTLDDAAGEALDKAAKILDLGYPGGPIIERLAKDGNPQAYNFPRALTGASGKATPKEHRFNFSFSGVKTALLYAVKDQRLDARQLADVLASYQAAVMEVLLSKSMAAAEEYAVPMLCLCGGVACNGYLRRRFQEECEKRHKQLILAEPVCCTDNAMMVAGLAWHYFKHGLQDDLSLPVYARLPEKLPKFPFAPAFKS